MQIERLIQHIESELPRLVSTLGEHHKAQAAERKQLLAAFKSSELTKLRDADEKLKQDVENASAALKEEEKKERDAEKTLQASTDAALAHLKKLQERWSGR